MLRIFYTLFLLVTLLSCSKQKTSSNEQYTERCQAMLSKCEPNCVEKTFRACFVDTRLFPDGPYDAFRNCHSVHVGNLCAPCEQLFSMNFGGAMRAVTCEEFLSAIDKKNNDKNCDGCLKEFGDSPFSEYFSRE